MVIPKGASFKACSAKANDVLCWAAARGNMKPVERLLVKSASLHIKDIEGKPSIQRAKEANDKDFVRLLTKHMQGYYPRRRTGWIRSSPIRGHRYKTR